ncbi:MAG: helix-turn-helix domain-containing protein [Actinocatenispora sp.]
MIARTEGTDIRVTIGVVGPPDLVSMVERVAARDYPLLSVRRLVHPDETQVAELVRTGQAQVDALLFTGLIAYTVARDAGVLDRPATYIPHSGASLYRVLLGLLARGRHPAHISIDTLDRDEVTEAFQDAGLPVDGVRVAEYRRARDSAGFADFHRAAAGPGATSVAITCVPAVHEALRDELEVIQLSPAVASVRSALRTVVLACVGRVSADAQVVLGIIDLSDPDPELPDEVGALAGSVFTTQPGRYVLVTTRGVVEEHSNHFQRLPLLARLSQRHLWAHIALGVGRSAAEAEALARHALARCRSVGPFSAVVSLGTGSDIVLAETDAEPSTDGAVPLLVAARRSGLSRATLTRLKAMLDQHGDEGVTASDVARALEIEPRSARRTLKRLERAGVAQPIGRVLAGTTGRPPTIYRIRLE